MRSSLPNGFFADGMMVYGPLSKGGLAVKGFVLGPPHQRGASAAQLNAYQDKIRNLLALLGTDLWAQFQWSCDGDYRPELTAAYREIIAIVDPAIGVGMNDDQIARRLGISEKTAKTHRAKIFKKLGIPTTPKLMIYAREHGLTAHQPADPPERSTQTRARTVNRVV